MNPQQKGVYLETRFYNTIRKELEFNHLGLNPDCCQVFLHKGYFSRDRNKNIIFDVSIEMFLPGADKWTLLWIWECKDYKTAVCVDDVEEFWAKLQQVGGVNVKGGMATTSAFQVSALRFANSKGISVVRLLPKDQIDWVVYATGYHYTTKEEYLQAFTISEFVGETYDFYGMSSGLLFQDIKTMLKSMWIATQEDKPRPHDDEVFRGKSVEKFVSVFGDYKES